MTGQPAHLPHASPWRQDSNGAVPFSFIDHVPRSEKPRSAGLTMMVDFGLPLAYQRDLLELAAPFIDTAKIAVGISGLIPEKTLRSKLEAYRTADVEPFPGGMFAELANHQQKIDEYLAECARLGYRLIEISDNVVHLSPQDRVRIIHKAIDSGFRVLAEVGSKQHKTDPQVLVSDARASLDAGAWKVLIEAFEFVTEEGIDRSLIRLFLKEVDPADVMFELPGTWLANVHAHEVSRLMAWLVENVGPDVNIANVTPDGVVSLETLRTGLGVTMRFDSETE